MTTEEIKQEAAKHYLPGSASYVAYCRGAEWAFSQKDEKGSELQQDSQWHRSQSMHRKRCIWRTATVTWKKQTYRYG